MFEIDKGIPVPESTVRKTPKYPFGQMNVGDSIAFPESERSRLSNSVAYHARKLGQKFTVRKVAPGQLRVWRVS